MLRKPIDPSQLTSTRCRILGHDICHEGARYYSIYSCRCCGFESEADSDYGLLPRLRTRWYFFKCSCKEKRDWFKPCSDCGRRFGRCDPKVDHIPF